MNDLLPLQEQLQQFIVSGDNSIQASIVSTAEVSAEIRLGIYRDGYRLRLTECLSDNFPALKNYLDQTAFAELCTAYIDAYPSTYRSIRWYGEKLPDFLFHYYQKSYSFLGELADFEWKMTLAFDAADAHRVQVSDVAAVPANAWAGLQFKLHPSVQRMNYCWNVISLWQALSNRDPLPKLMEQPRITAWVLWRTPDFSIHFYSLVEEEAWALDALNQGLSFGELCEGLCHWIPVEQVGERAASFLKGWIEKGLISRLIVDE